MPPKEAAVSSVPTDIPGILSVLAGDDNERTAAALGSLFSLEVRLLPQDEASAADLVTQVLQAAGSEAAGVRNAAVKALARLISISGPAQQLLLSNEQTTQHAWAVLTDMHIVWASYSAAVQQVMESGGFSKPDSGAGGKKPAAPAAKGAPATASDPEASLPGPSKQTLDAALRMLARLALQDKQALVSWLTNPEQGASEGGVPPVGDLVQLLHHHSTRVQYRAVQLLGVLASVPGFDVHVVAAHAVAALLALVGSSPAACIRLAACQALQVLLRSGGAAHAAAGASTAAETLVQLVTEVAYGGLGGTPSSPAPAAPLVSRPITPATAAGDVAAVTALDFKAPFPTKQGDVLLAALQLLNCLAHHSQEVTEQVALQGGLQLLLSMLPAPPEPFTWAGAEASTEAVAEAAPAASLEEPSDAEPTPEEPGSQPEQDQPECNSQPELAGSDELQPWQMCLASELRPDLPPLPSPETQEEALRLIGSMLSIPGLQAALHTRVVHAASKPAVPEPQVASEEGAPAEGQGAADTTAPPAGPPDLLAYLLGFFAGTPRALTPAALESPTKTGKGDKPKPAKGKEETPAAPVVPAHLLPPFPAAIRAAALHALVPLCRHPALAQILGSHPEILRLIATLGAPQADAAPALNAPPGAPVVPSTPPASTPRATAEAPSDAASSTPESATIDAGLAHAVALLVQALAASNKVTSGLGAKESAIPEEDGTDQANAEGTLTTSASQEELIKASKALSVLALDSAPADFLIKTSVASAVLALPETVFVAPARPPLPSPPPTPPPLPLATSVFLWDALDRPLMADGSVKLEFM